MSRSRGALWLRSAVASACAAAVVAGCVPAADPSSFPTEVPNPDAQSSIPPTVSQTEITFAPADLPSTRDAEQRRRAREMTVRIRATGCGELGTGSGFVIGDRLVVTNRHVVDGATSVSLNTWDGRSVEATVEGVDLSDDIAVVRVDRPLPSSAHLADADPEPGDEVTAVGFPLGGQQTLSSGAVVDYARLDTRDGPRILRVSAEIWPGSSGGPLVDEDGRVVGVVFALERATDYGLAIPVSDLRTVLDDGTDERAAPGC